MLAKLREHPLASASFRHFWLSQFITTFGNSFSGVALTWLLMELSDSTISRGITLALSMLPNLLLTPVAGSVIDRFSRRRMLIISDLIRCAIDLLLVLVLLTRSVTVLHIYTFSFLHSLARVFYNPCLTAFLPTLVPRPQLPQANSAQDLIMRVAMMVGPAVGGIAYSKLGAPAVIGVEALTLLASAFLLTMIRVEEKILPRGQSASMREQLASGWAYVRQNSWIIYQTSAMLLVNMSNIVFNIVWPLILKNQLFFGPEEHGLLDSVSSFASIITAMLLTGFVLRFSKKQVLVLSLAGSGLFTLGLMYSRSLFMVVFFIAAIGITRPALAVSNTSIYQAAVPSEYMGRVAVFRSFITQSLVPIVSLATGAFGDTVSYNTSLFIAGAMLLASSLLVYFKVNVEEESETTVQAA